MTHLDLVKALRDPLKEHGGKTYPAVHLFGISYAEELASHNLSLICEEAGISRNYATEVSKGRRLAPFVSLKT